MVSSCFIVCISALENANQFPIQYIHHSTVQGNEHIFPQSMNQGNQAWLHKA